MISHKVLMNMSIAIEAVLANRMRSVLTGLGIIFGVAAVIAMLAIGNGAQQEVLDQMKLVGVNNIVIQPVVEQSEEQVGDEEAGKQKKKFSPGLNSQDLEAIKEMIPGIKKISPEIMLDTYLINNGIRRTAKLVGVEPNYFDLFNFNLYKGKNFSEYHLKHGSPVCIIGYSIKTKFFPFEDPIGKYLKCGNNWLKVIGILEKRSISSSSIQNLGIRDYNMDVYTPLQTVLLRYKNRSVITEQMLRNANRPANRGGAQEDNSPDAKNYHQIDKMVVQVEATEQLSPIADIINRMLQRRHHQTIDYEIEIPEMLLKQQQRTNDIFNYVLGAIAGISLLVGGIGIMNIMLASVLERIKEIGLRMSMGAKKQDIINQFLFEAMMISVTGGLLGVLLGVSFAFLVSTVANIPTIVSFSSILLSFGVAAAVGLIFGIAPARKAAMQDPIQSLRYE
jgi:putative ABC transport system permease protein